MSFVVSLRDVMTFVIALASFCAALLFLARPGRRAFADMRDMREALIGEPAQPELGRPERPGLFVTVATMQATLEVVRHEMETNGGGSIKDHVARHTAELGDIRGDLAALKAAIQTVNTPNN